MPDAARDALLLRLTLETLHPVETSVIKSAGVSIEALFTPLFESLFAGLLPSQTLFRLWDMLFNIIWISQTSVVDIDLNYDQLKQAIYTKKRYQTNGMSNSSSPTAALPPSNIFTALCVGASAMNFEEQQQQQAAVAAAAAPPSNVAVGQSSIVSANLTGVVIN